MSVIIRVEYRKESANVRRGTEKGCVIYESDGEKSIVRRNRTWREDIRSERMEEGEEQEDDLRVEDLDAEDAPDEEMAEGGLHGLLQKPYMTSVLLGVIVLLLVCIIVLLVLMPGRRKAADTGSSLQQNITDYAQEQKLNDVVKDVSGEAVVVKVPEQDEAQDGQGDGTIQEQAPAEEPEEPPVSDDFVSADGDKTAVVVDIEDENDVAYTKEFILNEALPYFADNNQDAIWDLAHLKRYVKLSAQLEGTGQYYYMGDVNANGRPEGKGLAIYEKNSYYYGGWSDGSRSGEGMWFKFLYRTAGQRKCHGQVYGPQLFRQLGE